jgi:hypothetical protein
MRIVLLAVSLGVSCGNPTDPGPPDEASPTPLFEGANGWSAEASAGPQGAELRFLHAGEPLPPFRDPAAVLYDALEPFQQQISFFVDGVATTRPVVTPPMGRDLNGDGTVELVARRHTETGLRCCRSTVVWSVVDGRPQPLAALGGDSSIGGDFFDADGDGVLEFALLDGAFLGWHAPYANSMMPQVILRWQGGSWTLAPDLMQAPVPPDLAAKATKIRSDGPWDGAEPPFELVAAVVDPAFTGHEAEALAFVDAAWGDPAGGADALRQDFEQQLSKSAHEADLRRWWGSTP